MVVIQQGGIMSKGHIWKRIPFLSPLLEGYKKERRQNAAPPEGHGMGYFAQQFHDQKKYP